MGTDASAAGRRVPLLPIALLRPASDRRLVEQTRAGSEAAFEVLFARYHPAVLAFCRRILHSADEAEDAAQHTFVAAYRELAGGDAEIQLRPWLYTVARHRCLTLLRARRGRSLEDGAEPAVDRLVGDVTTREELRGVLADVARLPELQREALVLALLGDVPHSEIAASLGCPPAKVKALVFQAREALVAGRVARDTACADIRRQIEASRGAGLRRAVLRRHLSECAGCRAFREAVRSERRGLRLLLPFAPFAGLKRGLLALLGSGAPGGAALGPGALGVAGLAAAAAVTVSVPGSVVDQSVPAQRDPKPVAARVVATPAAPSVAPRRLARHTPAVVERPRRRAVEPQPAPRAPTPAHSPSPAPVSATPAPAPSADRPAQQATPAPRPTEQPTPAPPAQGLDRPRPVTPAQEHGRGKPPPVRPTPPNRPVTPPAVTRGHGPGSAVPPPGQAHADHPAPVRGPGG